MFYKTLNSSHQLTVALFPTIKGLVTSYREGGYKTGGGTHMKFYPYEKGGGGQEKF